MSQPESPNLLAALAYAARGWHVFPTHTGAGGKCSCGKSDCGSPGKHPRTNTGLHDATVDADQIRAWWSKWPRANVAIRTGVISGVLVLDLDAKHGDPDAMIAAVESITGDDCPPTAVSLTGGGGRHLLFALDPSGATAGNSSSQLGRGIDVRGEGGYIVAPPSVHASGVAYQWQESDPDDDALPGVAPAPADWLLRALAAVSRGRSDSTDRPASTGPRVYLDRVPDWLAGALSVLDPDCGYGEWIEVGMALEQVPGGFDLFDQWSRRAGHRYGGADAMAKAWRGIQGRVSKLTVGTIWERARQRGWTPPTRETTPPPDDRWAPAPHAAPKAPQLRVVTLDEPPPPDYMPAGDYSDAPPPWMDAPPMGSDTAADAVRRLDAWVATLPGLGADAIAEEVTTGWAPAALATVAKLDPPSAHRIHLQLAARLTGAQSKALKASVRAASTSSESPTPKPSAARSERSGYLFGSYYVRAATADRPAMVVRLAPAKEDALPREVPVCAPPVHVTSVHCDVDSGEFFTQLSWEMAGRTQTLDLPQDQTHTSRLLTGAAKHGLPVSSSTASEVVDYLVEAEAECVSKRGMVLTTRRTGWHGGAFLRGLHVHGDPTTAPTLRVGDREHRALVDAVTESGTLAGWVAGVSPALQRCEPLRMYVAAALVPPLLDVLGTLVEPFIVDMVSTTSQGKTTALRVAASTWGNPPAIQREWNTTFVALDRLLGMCNGLPVFLNESQLGPRANPGLYSQMVYSLVSRVGKARGSVTGLQRQERYLSVTLSNGENSLSEMASDGGLKARCVTYFGSPWGGVSDEHRVLATRTREAAEANYGHAAKAVVAHLVSLDDAKRAEIREVFRSLCQSFIDSARAMYPDHGVAARLATYVAACEVAGWLLTTTTGVLPASARWVTDYVWRRVLERSATADRATAALEEVIAWLGSNPDEWATPGATGQAPLRGWIGVASRHNRGDLDRLHILPNRLHDYLSPRGYVVNTMLSTWAERGWIAVEADKSGKRFTVKRSVGGDACRCVSFTADGIAKINALLGDSVAAPVRETDADAAGWGY